MDNDGINSEAYKNARDLANMTDRCSSDKLTDSTGSKVEFSFRSMTKATNMNMSIKKSLRPLTAFHIFSQLEKEYIMQRMGEGNTMEQSSHTKASKRNEQRELENHGDAAKNKKEVGENANVPKRYQGLKLSPDWCASPGKC